MDIGDDKHLSHALEKEATRFHETYEWLKKEMPETFFDEVTQESIMLITHSLMGFPMQEYFSTIHLKRAAIVMCLDSPDADLRILKDYTLYGIKTYQTYISKEPLPKLGAHLRIAFIYFTEAIECVEEEYPEELKGKLRALVKQRNPHVTDEEFDKLINSINTRFLRALPLDRLILALDMFFRAKIRDNCQYEVRYNEDWEESGKPSMEVVLAWRNTPRHNFLYRLARTIHRHGLIMKRVNAAYIDPYSKRNVLLMSLELHGIHGDAAWDVANIPNFLRELATTKYFASFDLIDEKLVETEAIPSYLANFLRSAVNFIHQMLVHIDPNMYTIENIEADLCRHPELANMLTEAFRAKFDPETHSLETYGQIREVFLEDVNKLDTGNEENDLRRRNVLNTAILLIHYSLKTNYFRMNYTATCFRLDPKYMHDLPFSIEEKFPELPFGIFFMKGMHFFGFHIRFKDLARGGVRTVYPRIHEQMVTERNRAFTECYHLAHTQQKKNKDIPEGGSKGVIFLKPYDRLESETLILEKEFEAAALPPEEVEQRLEKFQNEQLEEYLFQAQRSYIESLITVVNCDWQGKIRAKYMVDYWKRPEYIYLGPDENMFDPMIQWIAWLSRKYGYKPGGSFISGKPELGINHKEFGVTSLGVNVYMEKALEYLGIDPKVKNFTVKMSGGPDGDVAGNQILNLHKYYPKTAKLVALTDVSGTIYDPEGLDLDELVHLFKQSQPIKFYPPKKLHEGGFLLDRFAKKTETAFSQQTLCWRMRDGKLVEEWLSGSDMNHLFRYYVHKTYADVFIPAGGRPRTINRSNVEDFLDEKGQPTARCIIEGANLYLTTRSRKALEKKGVLIIKDSSANKTGVICSSFEILSGLTLSDEQFRKHKPQLIEQILERLQLAATHEADLILRTHKETEKPLTEISDAISKRINQFTYQLLDFLDEIELSNEPTDPLIQTFLSYCLPELRENFQDELLSEIPEHHKKAIISCHIAAKLVYTKGLNWFPSIVDILPILLEQKEI